MSRVMPGPFLQFASALERDEQQESQEINGCDTLCHRAPHRFLEISPKGQCQNADAKNENPYVTETSQ